MPLLDDICAQIHGQSDGVDEKFLVKLNQQVAQNDHFRGGAECFIVKHYAGEVMYQVDGFCDRNRDILYADLIQLTQSSSMYAQADHNCSYYIKLNLEHLFANCFKRTSSHQEQRPNQQVHL
jgi:myosin heavy subunit